ncbi:MAG: anthranilate phosphoribosyltransferase [Cyanobacteria bacterium K_Offshore_0m_m2_072]|nr:anthranilate phosphoribosyltransferase [Cyanobacteria bacterium K_Offshore_0m_m2_072]
MSTPPVSPLLLEQLLVGTDLNTDQATALMQAWLGGTVEPVMTGALLAALRSKGVNGEELAAMAAVLREACSLPGERPALQLVDTCGTGGANVGRGYEGFNISTAVAFTAAACGVAVAKHGNRSASGRVGSADVLEALGLDLQTPTDQALAALSRVGVTFLFAPGWHPSLAGLAPLRRALGVRTVFNLLGPLVNPLRPEAHVLGVARRDLLDPMADALRRLGMTRAVVVHGHSGLDEADLSGPSELRLLEQGAIRTAQLDPGELGLGLAPLEAIAGGGLETNRAILEAVLQGRGTPAQRDVVALNSALVLWVAGRCSSFADGLEAALAALAAGLPWERLEGLRQALGSGAVR